MQTVHKAPDIVADFTTEQTTATGSAAALRGKRIAAQIAELLGATGKQSGANVFRIKDEFVHIKVAVRSNKRFKVHYSALSKAERVIFVYIGTTGIPQLKVLPARKVASIGSESVSTCDRGRARAISWGAVSEVGQNLSYDQARWKIITAEPGR